ncbi:carboxymuconolactone decarboxylase family protein [Frankia sp. CiP3]|uniref:carboxymuconolactone decarboxylase family protein n=1 Tax=Frankia sp. CiP3 TaxID=2880971 RepID=UPI001EF42DD1|nr:hypothetical protein [Frankia sp. CiP3]
MSTRSGRPGPAPGIDGAPPALAAARPDGSLPADTPRIPLIGPPYTAEAEALLTRIGQPPDGPRPPLALVRAYAAHPTVAGALAPVMDEMLRLIEHDPAVRETLVLRVCARAGCWSEWGIHAAVAQGRIGLSPVRIAGTLVAAPDLTDTDEATRAVIELADELHDHASVPPSLWDRLTALWTTDEILELLTIAGFYRLVAQTANALRVPAEVWALRPADLTSRRPDDNSPHEPG